jgi:hypothetical protein
MEPEKRHLMEALKFHPRGDEKMGVGIREFKVVAVNAKFSFQHSLAALLI